MEMTEEYINSLEALLAGLELPDTEVIEDIEIPDILPIDYADLPELSSVLDQLAESTAEVPVAEDLESIDSLDTTVYPTRNLNFEPREIAKPAIAYISRPSKPALKTVDVPSKPDLSLPEAPTFDPLTFPTLTEFSVPAFEAIAPTFTPPEDPSNIVWVEAPYNSEINVALFAKVLRDIQEGGTGLEIEVETAIYERARERQRVENEDLYTKVMDHYGSNGFNFPTGILGAKLTEMLSEASRKTDQTNREILISQADLAQKNTHFTIEQAGVLEKMLRDFHNAQANRSFEYAKAVAQIGVQIVSFFNDRERLKFEVFSIYATAFRTQLEAAVVHVDIFRSKLEAIKTQAGVYELYERIYVAQVNVVETAAKIYNTEMEAARIHSQIEALKIELFKSDTEAYVAALNGERIKAEIYTSEVEAEKARTGAFGEIVRAYSTEIQARKSQLDSQLQAEQLKLQRNNQRLELLKVELAKFQSILDQEFKNASLNVEAFKIESALFDSKVKAKGIEYDTKVKETETAIKRSTLLLEKYKAQLDSISSGYIALKSLQEKGTEGIMNVAAQLTASAMTAVNATASVSSTNTDSTTEMVSDNTSTNYNYNYER
jgi:hypothetical protein